jgi:hypothetical protein
MVEHHHKLRPCTDAWVETFRLADRVDVTGGLVRAGLTRGDVKTVVAALPYHGFHTMLTRAGIIGAAIHQLRPLPTFHS